MCTTSSELGKVLRQQEAGLQSEKVTISRDFRLSLVPLAVTFLHADRGPNPRSDFLGVISRPPDVGFPSDFFLNNSFFHELAENSVFSGLIQAGEKPIQLSIFFRENCQIYWVIRTT